MKRASPDHQQGVDRLEPVVYPLVAKFAPLTTLTNITDRALCIAMSIN